MSEPIAARLRLILKEDAAKYEHARLPKDTRKAIEDAAQRLEGKISEAKVEASAVAAYDEYISKRGAWLRASESAKAAWKKIAYAALEAARDTP